MVSHGFESPQHYPFREGVGNTHTSESTERTTKAEGGCVLGQSRTRRSAEPGGQGLSPGRWPQLTELVVVALEKGLATLLLLAGLLAAAGGITATVFLSSGGEIGVVLESKKSQNNPPQGCLSPFGGVGHLFLHGPQLCPLLCPRAWLAAQACAFVELQDSSSRGSHPRSRGTGHPHRYSYRCPQNATPLPSLKVRDTTANGVQELWGGSTSPCSPKVLTCSLCTSSSF